jgi:type II secretory pathway pseudopilin PulG
MRERRSEEGFTLVGLVVAIFLILLVLAVAAPKVAKDLKRDREVEAVHRGNQYVRAVQLYYRKFGHYPGSIEQLEKTNNIRFLRQKYVDPMTGKADWRLIHLGEAKTTVKGFFGAPLTGLAPGLGSAAGLASSGGIGAGAAGSSAGGVAGSSGLGSSGSAFGGSSGSAFGGASSGSGFGGASSGSAFGGGSSGSAFGGSSSGSAFGSAPGSAGAGTGAAAGAGSAAGTPGAGSGTDSSSSGMPGGGGAIVGFGSAATGPSIIDLNEQITYETWEFIYDPRIEQLKAQVNLFGAAGTSTGTSGLGSASGNLSPGLGGAAAPTTSPMSPTSPASPTTPP